MYIGEGKTASKTGECLWKAAGFYTLNQEDGSSSSSTDFSASYSSLFCHCG